MPRTWLTTLIGLGLWLALALGLGWWLGGILWWLIAALASYLGLLLVHVFHLDRALRTGSWPIQYNTSGLWPEVFAKIQSYRSKARRRKKKA